MLTSNRCCVDLSTSKDSQPVGPEETAATISGRLVSRPGAVLPVCTVEGVLALLGVHEADELHLAGLVGGGLVLLALVVLFGGPLLGRLGGHHLTTLFRGPPRAGSPPGQVQHAAH